MGTSEVFSFFLFFVLVMISANISVLAEDDCSIPSNYFCRPYGLVPRFPFRIKDQQPDSCGYPGFTLTCKQSSQLLLNYTFIELPLSGEFLVREIDYVKQKIVLTDPNGCLPKRLLYTVLNLSDSPFKSVYYQNYTFLNCTYQILYDFSLSKHIIYCLSIGNGYVVATSSMTLVGEFHRYCEVIKTVSVPVPVPIGSDSTFFGDNYWRNLTLSWNEPYCGYCEEQNLGCRLRNKNSHETKCFKKSSNFYPNLYPKKKRRITTGAIYILSIGIGLPVLLGFIWCLAFWIRVCCSEDDVHQLSNVELSNAISPQPIIPVISLNASAIDSYPKIVLGESRRLPKPDDNTCPICLSEYLPKETLKIIPECNHNFHADCIDQWLHTNMTCPVCRNSPT